MTSRRRNLNPAPATGLVGHTVQAPAKASIETNGAGSL
jgi:hypothetical protein